MQFLVSRLLFLTKDVVINVLHKLCRNRFLDQLRDKRKVRNRTEIKIIFTIEISLLKQWTNQGSFERVWYKSLT